MTTPFTERLHRRVNWPPGCCHPPDRGRTVTANLHPQEQPHGSGISGSHNLNSIRFQKLFL